MRLQVLVAFIILLFDFRPHDNKQMASVYPPILSLESQMPVDNYVAEPLPETLSDRIDRFFSKRASWNQFNGVVLFAKEGKVFSKAYGFKNIRTKDSLNIHTSFQLASVSKPLTATAILQLIEKGKLHLDDLIDQYLPDFPYPGITIEMLLTHQSGLPNYLYITDDNWDDEEIPLSNQEAYEIFLCEQPLRYYRPGRRYNYCNTNYFLLANILERVSGMSFPEYMKENIFEPAGMKDAFVFSDGCYREHENVALGHKSNRRPYPEYYLSSVYGDKSIYASVLDLYAFDRALREGIILSDSMQKLAYTGHLSRWYANRQYGYGWRIKAGQKNIVYHNGWWQGYRSTFIRDLSNDITIVVLRNTLHGAALNQNFLLSLLKEEKPV